MVPREPYAEYGRLVDDVRIKLDAFEAGRRRVQRRLGETDARPARNLLGRDAEDSLPDQQVVGEVEILQASAGEPLEDLAIALHHGAETCAKRLVLPLALDVLCDCFAHGV